MPRPRFSNLDPARQRQVLERAADEFATHGYHHASLNHIIEALGLNKGVFYYYFDGKADLFGAVVQMAWERFVPAEGFDIASLDERTFWPSVEALLRENHRRLGEEPWLAGISRLLSNPPAGVDEGVARLLARGHVWAKALLRRGQEVGAVRTDLPVELLLDVVTTADQSADRWLLANWDRLTPAERERGSRTVCDIWRRLASPAERG